MCLEFVGAELGLNRVFLLLTRCAYAGSAMFDAPLRWKGTVMASWKETESDNFVRSGISPRGYSVATRGCGNLGANAPTKPYTLQRYLENAS
jgi:hypothetical protein